VLMNMPTDLPETENTYLPDTQVRLVGWAWCHTVKNEEWKKPCWGQCRKSPSRKIDVRVGS
jgi:hypothetical protein